MYHLFGEMAHFSCEGRVPLVQSPGRDFGNGGANFRRHILWLACGPPVDLKQLLLNLPDLQCQTQDMNILPCFIELLPATYMSMGPLRASLHLQVTI